MDPARAHLPEEIPLVCTLSAAERTQRAAVVSDLLGEAEQTSELSDGYAYRFPGSADWAARLLDYVVFERQCCRFFTFELAFEPNQGPIWLRLRGPEGVKQLIGGDHPV